MRPSDNAYLNAAKDLYAVEGLVEIDDNAEVSLSSDGGAYVSAWVWVYDEDCLPPDAASPSNGE